MKSYIRQEVEQEAAKIDIVRPAFIASRQLQTSMKTKGSSVLVDTRSYLLTVANSSQSRKQVAEEVSHLVVALNTKMQNLLDYSHAKRYKLQFKSKAIQTEIEVFSCINRTE